MNNSFESNINTKSRKKIIILSVFIIIILGLVGARIYLPYWLKDYVNNILNNIDGYKGSVADIDVHLYRGAYTIRELKISKKENGIPVPFFESEVMDISVQWGALIHGRIVSDIDLTRPVINFAVNSSGTSAQTGKEVDWTKPLKDLVPFDINLITFTQGKIAYKNYAANPNVDIYINNLGAEIRNLQNIEDKNNPLPSSIFVKGDSIGNGKFSLDGKLNILKQTPDMDLNMKLEKAKLSSINNYSRAFAAIDFEKGDLSIYSEIVVKNSIITGYVKPIANDISIIDFKKNENPAKVVWESAVSVFIQLFKNQPKDQLATKVFLSGNLKNVKTNTWETILGIFKNGFVQAFSKATDGNIDFKNAK